MGPEQLYLLPPDDFTAARDEAAKAAKAAGHADVAKELRALRKPSVAAWLVNRLVAEQPDLVDQLLDLGPALAAAQAEGQGDELRTLGAQRRALVDAVVTSAVQLADRPVSAAVRDEVASSLEAGLADPGAAAAVRSGRLVRALSYAGFGGVDLDGAVAVAATRSPAAPKKKDAAKDDRAERVAAAEAAALDAAGRLDDAVRACEAAHQEQNQAAVAQQEATAEVDRLEQALQEARERRTAAEHAARMSSRRATRTEQAVNDAQASAEKARSTLDRLRCS